MSARLPEPVADSPPPPARTRRRAAWVASCLVLLVGCQFDMATQPKILPYQESTFFADGKSARLPVPGTVARGQLRADRVYYTGMSGEQLVDTIPMKITREDLERGRQRYNIYCAPCHDRAGTGHGTIVQRGFSPPPSLQEQRLRDAPVGHFYHVIANGYGAMYSYAARVEPDDRWRIAAYIRALQLSQNATLEDIPAEERSHLEGAAP